MKYLTTIVFALLTINCLGQNEEVIIGGGNINNLSPNFQTNSDVQFIFGNIDKDANFRLQVWEYIDGEKIMESDNIADLQENLSMKVKPKTILLLVPSKEDGLLKLRKMIPGQSLSVIPLKPAEKDKWDFKSLTTDLFQFNNTTPFLLIYDTNKITNKEKLETILSQTENSTQPLENIINELSLCSNHFIILSYLYEIL